VPFLRVQGLEKSFRSALRETRVLGGVELSVEQGEFVSIVGYSGSGKTTLISLLGGLLEPDTGEIVLDGERVREPGPERGIVFQQYSLLPWLTVHENVALAVDAVHPGASVAERRRLTESFVQLVNLTESAWKRPGQLSGGMRQRVNVARALALEPKLLLMDEPFSALDALTRATLQDELLRIWTQRRCTVVLVTNDVDEAILLSDRIHPMTPGPGAVLGPAIEVGLARPRERRHLSLTPAYQQARQELVQFLRTSRRGTGAHGGPDAPTHDVAAGTLSRRGTGVPAGAPGSGESTLRRRRPADEVAHARDAHGRDLAPGEDLPRARQASGDHPGL
jgi:nitrate/nitrite transport system ATP-binding protein